jgi:hypothetical protein
LLIFLIHTGSWLALPAFIQNLPDFTDINYIVLLLLNRNILQFIHVLLLISVNRTGLPRLDVVILYLRRIPFFLFSSIRGWFNIRR